ncbi:6325_t:CDS:10 [Rhizophagus irregularis]|nr:6325_t:CDS:10 [Rhizophagus irregularis]
MGSEKNIETQCPFSSILKIFTFIINCQLDILLSSRSPSSEFHKLISTIDQFVCKELFGQDILLEHQQQQQKTDKNCTIWWISWFYESSWNNDLLSNGNLHHLFDITDIVIDILGRYIPKLNKEAEISLISKENEQQKDDSREIRKNYYVLLSELFVKMIQITIRSLDEVLIPIIMVHVESMKQSGLAENADINIIALKILIKLFEIPSISQIIVENTQLREQVENWKKSYACKLVKSGIIRIVLEQKFTTKFTNCNFEVFDSFIIVIIRILAGFQSEYRHVINKKGNIIPHNIAFANLPPNISNILSILANDSTRETIQLKQQLDRTSLAILFVSVTCGDQIMKDSDNELSASLIYQTLTKFITKYLSLDFLYGISMIHFLYLFITFEAGSNNLSEFKPYTYSKILSGLQATFTIRENETISFIEQLFFSYDYVFMPWIWRVVEGSWNLKGFVASLLDIDTMIHREIRVNIKKDFEREFIKVGKLLFKNTFAAKILLMTFSNLGLHNDDNGKIGITRLFMIITSIFFCIVISHYNQFDYVQSLEEEKVLMTNVSKFWIEMIKLIVAPNIIENTPTDWWPIVNIIVLTLGYHFDSAILSGTINLAGVLDHTLKILQDINKTDEININNPEKSEKSARLMMISHFLMIFSCMKNETGKTVAQEIKQHPILLSTLRQWTFNKENINMVEIAGNDTIYNEVKSSIIGLLSLTISTDLNDQQQVFPTIYELEAIVDEFKREPSLLAGHLCTIVSSGSLSMTGEFKQKMRLMFINIWSMLRDFIVSEIDNHFTWLMLSPVTNAFEIMIEQCDANLSNRKQMELLYVKNYNTIRYIPLPEENIIKFFISLIKNIIEEQKIDFIFLETLLRMLYQLHENSLLSDSQRIKIHALIHPIYEESRMSSIMKTSIHQNTIIPFDHIFIMVRPYPNYQFKLFSLGKENRIDEDLERF